MDLNRFRDPALYDCVWLAPSWSHGSKSDAPIPENGESIGWLPRGAMDLNPDSFESMLLNCVGSLVEPWI